MTDEVAVSISETEFVTLDSVEELQSIAIETTETSVVTIDAEIVTVESVEVVQSIALESVEIGQQGPRGIQGPPGPQGASGLAGTDHNELANRDAIDSHPASAISGLMYVHQQLVPESIWLITHNLNRNPSTTVMDSAESVVHGDIQHNSSNQLTISFSSAFAGTAYLV